MPITELHIHSFRNLSSAHIETSAQFNIFYGSNTAGKTSLLEAIYFLGLGRSFRTNLADRVISTSADSLTIHVELTTDERSIPIGIERNRGGSKRIRIDGENIHTLSALARLLPLQLMSTESYRYFSDGPKSRRHFMDWGVFHVEQTFYAHWKRLQQILKQRNAAIKGRLSPKEITSWDHELTQTVVEIDRMRSSYVKSLEPILQQLLATLIANKPLKLTYSRGWGKEKDYQTLLKTTLPKDQQLGYTQYGPQRADLQLYFEKIPVQDVLSQGEQKLAAYALHLAQGILYKQQKDQSPIYLIDDLPSELDPERCQRLTEVLTDLKAQVFITGITKSALSSIIEVSGGQLFHVKHGEILPS